MKKIYYLQKHEVKLGDTIEYNGIKTIVTKELISLNPELFRVEENTQPINFNNNCFDLATKAELEAYKQELLAEAKRRYPIGTRFKSINGLSTIYIIEGDYLQWSPYYPHYITCGLKGVIIYTQKEDKWAEIITPKFTSEDGVNIYGDMKTYMVYSNLTMSNKNINNEGTNSTIKYFYHKENALAYIEKHREKTLEDYENMLLRTNIDSINAREVCLFYHTLKKKEPKLYYTKILQLIADDLNDGWVADFSGVSNPAKFYITSSDWNTSFNIDIPGVVYFKSRKLAEKARDILGDKVKNIFD